MRIAGKFWGGRRGWSRSAFSRSDRVKRRYANGIRGITANVGAGLIAAESVRAAETLSSYLRPTPARLTEHFSEQLGVEIYLKPENFQRTGSFKVRGGIYALKKLESAQHQWGVVTASAGNHAQGVAFAAKQLGVKALVVMPEFTPNTKLDAVRALGAETELFGSSFDDAYERARAHEKERGLTMIPPFDHLDVIAGQGTLGLEILKEVPDVGTILVPVGGGGLISGLAAVVKTQKPDVRVIGVVAEGAASLVRSLDAGKILESDAVQTIADGIAVKRSGELCFPLIQELVDQVVSVSDDAMANAILDYWSGNGCWPRRRAPPRWRRSSREKPG